MNRSKRSGRLDRYKHLKLIEPFIPERFTVWDGFLLLPELSNFANSAGGLAVNPQIITSWRNFRAEEAMNYRLDHIALNCSNLDEAVSWNEKYFGRKATLIRRDGDGDRICFVNMGDAATIQLIESPVWNITVGSPTMSIGYHRTQSQYS